VEGALWQGADCLVFPEYFTSELLTTFPEARTTPHEGAERVFDRMGREYKEAYLDLFKGLARDRGIYIVGGSLFYFDDEDGRYYNASFLFNPDGGVREQRKTHRAYELVYNREMVTAGEELGVFETDVGKVGITICYDAAFPETARILMVTPSSKSHAVARCPGAVDALCLMYTTTKYTKEAMFPHTGTWTLNKFVLAADDATSDNLPPRFSQIQYSWRSPTLAVQQQIYEVLENNARHAAAATGCEASVRWVTKTRIGLANHAMAELTYRNLELVGAPEYTEQARSFAREIQENLGLSPMKNPFPEEHERLITPQEAEAKLRQSLPPWQLNFTSDDYVEYTWHAPSVRLYTARPRLESPRADYTYPAWAINAMGGRPEIVDPGMFVAGKTLAATLLDLLTHPEELEKARAEFNERTGGGVGGSKWLAPLLAPDFPPPVDLRWPEYVQTVRGEEWWIPTPASDAGVRL
jgi:aminobenzoyl-glutamate utilization protein B